MMIALEISHMSNTFYVYNVGCALCALVEIDGYVSYEYMWSPVYSSINVTELDGDRGRILLTNLVKLYTCRYHNLAVATNK